MSFFKENYILGNSLSRIDLFSTFAHFGSLQFSLISRSAATCPLQILLVLTLLLLLFISAGSRSSSPGKLLCSTYSGMSGGPPRVSVAPQASEKRSKIPRSQGCSREASPNRLGLGKTKIKIIIV